MGNNAPDEVVKKIVLDNIYEEFGGEYTSHEKLYHQFAESAGVDLKPEFVHSLTNDAYILEFNKGHLLWLHSHSWMHCLAAFAAYEHLDNVDYPALSALVASLGFEGRDVLFFKVHEKVEHFHPIRDILQDSWGKFHKEIVQGFNFIGSHQVKMWTELSKRIFNEVSPEDERIST